MDKFFFIFFGEISFDVFEKNIYFFSLFVGYLLQLDHVFNFSMNWMLCYIMVNE